MPEMVPLDFLEEDVIWVAYKISGTAGALEAEATYLKNWLFCFEFLSEEFRVLVADLDDWMANSSPPWASYCVLIACHLVSLDKRPGLCPVWIGGMLC